MAVDIATPKPLRVQLIDPVDDAHRSPHESRRNGVDKDASGREVQGEPPAVLVQGRLRHRIVAGPKLGPATVDRCDVNDPPAADHKRHGGARQVNGAIDHNVEWLPPLRNRRLDRVASYVDARAVHQCIQRAPVLRDCRSDQLGSRRVAVVARADQVLAQGQAVADLLKQMLAARREADVPALAREPYRSRFAYA